MVSKQQLIDEQFATQASVDALSRIARSGAYQDLLGIPDLSVYMEKNRVSAEYMDTGEVGTALREYMKQNEVSEVGKTGRFEDLIGAPAMTEYQRVDEMNQYVKASDFDNEMLTVLKADTFGGADVADLENISDFDNKLLAYPKKSELSAVAFSGQYKDVLGTGDIIDRSALDTRLLSYVSKVELNQERGQIDDAYFDDAELTDILENVRFQIHQDRDATLSSNHYTKVQANERIATAIDSHEANEMANAIQDAIVNVASNEMVNNELSLYPVKSELKPIVDNSKNTYLQSSTYESNKAIYATDAYLSERLPRGSIIMWNGSSVPSGWALCNGGHGTPNLSGRFIVAYGNGYGIGNTGGTNHITITTAQMPTHKHGASSNNKLGDHNHGGTSSSNETDSHSHTGTITSGGVAHNHGSVWGTQSHAHNHSVSLNNESVSHGHTMSAFQHRHQGIYTQFGKEVNNDDFNNDGGTGPSWQGGVR